VGRVFGGVQRLDRDAVRGDPVQGVHIAAGGGLGGGLGPCVQRGGFEFGVFVSHIVILWAAMVIVFGKTV
jgi:hypothetical protein